MITNTGFKKTALILVSVTSLLAIALPLRLVAGGLDSGGGDAAEVRIDDIRVDLLGWIIAERAASLSLPQGITYEMYVQQMTSVLQRHAVVIGMVSTLEESTTQDSERRVMVDGQLKTCRGFTSVKDHHPHILCSIERFVATSESDQYVLIHHEYAGLTGIEQNQGASSDYEVSKQITDYLTRTTVLKLAIKLKSCSDLTIEDRANLGQKCRTSKGAIFERVERAKFGEAWKLVLGVAKTEIDQEKIYSDRLPDLYGNRGEHHWFETQAWEACQKLGGKLPSKEEFERGEMNGFREVLPNMLEYYFWSAVVHPGYGYFPYIFVGRDGYIYLENSEYSHYDNSVRCVTDR